jgi:hypothetical protein
MVQPMNLNSKYSMIKHARRVPKAHSQKIIKSFLPDFLFCHRLCQLFL